MILDTCALLWLASGDTSLSIEAREAISHAPVVHISAISAFEIALKWTGRKLALPIPPAEWFSLVTTHHDLTVVSLDSAICLAAAALPPIHRDPADRFIIATARLNRWPIITADPVFREYGLDVVW
ncbi:MAG: type II toxin-antitoxin system VapC family toxin [Bradymonadales bacterium]|nr:type II toxin-antitoxin system VapC family toxin [Bradymonadales bacterium]